MRLAILIICPILLCVGGLLAEELERPEVRDGIARLPHVEIDVQKRQVRVECEVIHVDMPLEFFCVVSRIGPEHETILRTEARPSHIHLGLLMLGLEPGQPVRWSPAAKRWLPPQGPPLHINIEYERGGETVSVPAYRWMRNLRTGEEMPPLTWVFVGSRVMEDGAYAADITGYVVSVVNFDVAPIDVPELASSANELLEWETNPDLVPDAGTRVWMVIEPTGRRPEVIEPAADVGETVVRLEADGRVLLDGILVAVEELTERLREMHEERPIRVRLFADPAAGREAAQGLTGAITAARVPMAFAAPGMRTSPANNRDNELVTIDEQRLADLRQRWEQAVAPHEEALREAAQTHYDVIRTLRDEQQRLIDEADRIQRLIEQLERQYQDLTTPRPE